ncbi:MAG: hypothetical protein VKL42_04105 [Snowella sp.]|nr:hypothetical protein [Snowella sp.]
MNTIFIKLICWVVFLNPTYRIFEKLDGDRFLSNWEGAIACQILKLKNRIAVLYLAKINFGVEPNHTRIVF